MKLLKFIPTIIATFCLILVFISCSEDNDNNKNVTKESFTITNKEEKMPVWVHGKSDAKYILLAVHGGPGSDVLDFRNYKNGTGFKAIEDKFLVAYWQQRASGQSTGSNNEKYFTIAQYAEDCDKVIDVLKTRYPGKKIVLLGHSWGGMLTSYYLRDAARRAKVVAWIDAAGATHGQTLMQASTDNINAEADRRIAAGQEVKFWKETKSNLLTYPDAVNQIAYGVTEKIPEVVVKVNNSDFTINDRGYISNATLFSEIIKTDNTPYLKQVKMPSLFLWGKYDYAVPSQQRDEVIANIGSSSKKSVIFNASGHYMMFHEPQVFSKSIIDFINGL